MSAGEKDCIWCGETIKASARICRFCNRSQSEEPAPDTSAVAARAPESESADADEEVFYDGPAFLEPEAVGKWAPHALFAVWPLLPSDAADETQRCHIGGWL